MARYIARRMAQMFILFLVFLFLTFFILQALPGDAVLTKLSANPNLPPEAFDLARARLGLDKPPLLRFWDYLINFFQGDLGFSYWYYPKQVTTLIGERLPRTLVLFSTALLVTYWAGFITGKYLAWRRNTRGEMAITIAGVTLYTVFYPWFAVLLIWLFAIQFEILPINQFITVGLWAGAGVVSNDVFMLMTYSTGIVTLALFTLSQLTKRMENQQLGRALRLGGGVLFIASYALFWASRSELEFALDIGYHMILPVMTLTLIGFAGIMLLTRSSMLETMKEDYILTARAKGLTETAVRDNHAARTALLPVTTSLVLAVAAVIDGGVVTETVFSWPGMGELLVTAVTQEDVPVALAAFSLIGVLAVVGHLVADILYGILDPRIRV